MKILHWSLATFHTLLHLSGAETASGSIISQLMMLLDLRLLNKNPIFTLEQLLLELQTGNFRLEITRVFAMT